VRNIRSKCSLPAAIQCGQYQCRPNLYVGLVCGWGTTPVLPLTSLSLQPSGGRRQQMNSLNTDDHPRCIVWSVCWSVTASISHPMLQWTNRSTGCTKITISIRFDFQSKKRFLFRFRWS